ncbi:MAG: ParB/RepB/Spo0J family partition protein [Patescibacteria group bacterium]|nr:ParB/RepB/Spo0J family partition protein [Patescibacteria group bacterium]MCL5094207.1 ParB/RepB/Spo0J family partition protein [Patescibacteria group bacterium]
MSARNIGLGRGLDSLIPLKDDLKSDSDSSGQKGDLYKLEIFKIKPNPHQPRREFKDEDLRDLANSIKVHGIIQPLVVTKEGEDFILIAGERRLKAAEIAGLKEVPVIFRETKDIEKLEIALIENIQRADLNPLEEATAYKKLLDAFSLTQEEVARKVGKARSTVANTMRLLSLPVEVKRGLREGKITEGHARAILALPTLEQQLALYNSIISGSLNVRQAEARVKKGPITMLKEEDNLEIKSLIQKLSEFFGTKVTIQRKGAGGKIQIEYYSDEELERIYKKLIG